jgi:hypothetical protein
MFDPDDDPFDAAWSLLALVGFAQLCDPGSIAGLVERARPIAAPLANPGLDTLLAFVSGFVASQAGNDDDARRHCQHAVDLAVRTGDQYIEGFALSLLLGLAVIANDPDADDLAARTVARLYDTRNWMVLWSSLQTCGVHLAYNGATEPASVILGHLEAHGRYPPGLPINLERRRRLSAEHAATAESAASMAHGAGLDRDQLVAYTLRIYRERV